MNASFRNALACVLVTGLLAGCGTREMMRGLLGGGGDAAPTNVDTRNLRGAALAPDLASPDEKAVAGLYNEGLAALNDRSYKKAMKKFGEVERQHPYSKWATKAILMQAFAAYQNNSYADSVNASKRFVTLHPGHKDAPYAYYLIALSEYEQIADARRDQRQTLKAVEALDEIARRYPDTRYAADAEQKARLARDRLAAKEMEVGRYYLKRGSHLAGINRFKNVVTSYQTSTHTPEALYRLAEGYLALGVVSEARTAAAVLGHNYPNSQWYKDAYTLVSSDGQAPVASESSWISKAFKGITG